MKMFSYWEGPKPPYIELCQEALLRHCDATIYTPESVKQIPGMDKFVDDPYYQSMCPAHRADIIRIKALEAFGGGWIDADFITLNSLQPLLDASKRHHCLYYYRDSWQATNGILIAPTNHTAVIEWSRKIDAVFSNLKRMKETDIPWCSFGADQLEVVLGIAIDRTQDLGWDRVQLIPFTEKERFFSRGNVRDKSWPGAYGYMLFNTSFPNWFKKMSKVEILEQDMVISHLFRVALGLDTH